MGSLTEHDAEAAVGRAACTNSEEGEAKHRNKSFLTFTHISNMLSSCFCVLFKKGFKVSAVIKSISFLSSDSSLLRSARCSWYKWMRWMSVPSSLRLPIFSCIETRHAWS